MQDNKASGMDMQNKRTKIKKMERDVNKKETRIRKICRAYKGCIESCHTTVSTRN